MTINRITAQMQEHSREELKHILESRVQDEAPEHEKDSVAASFRPGSAMSSRITPIRKVQSKCGFELVERNSDIEQSIREHVSKIMALTGEYHVLKKSEVYCDLVKGKALDSPVVQTVFKIEKENQWQRAQLFRALALPGICKENCQILKMTQTTFERFQMILGVAEKAEDIADIQGCVTLAKTFNSKNFQADILSVLVTKALNINKFKEAVEIANQIPFTNNFDGDLTLERKSWALEEIGNKLLSVGLINEAVMIMNQIPNWRTKSMLLSVIVKKYLQIDEIWKAADLIQKIQWDYRSDEDLLLISQKLSNSEELLEEIISGSIDKQFKDGVLWYVALNFAKKNNPSKGFEIAWQLSDINLQVGAVCQVINESKDSRGFDVQMKHLLKKLEDFDPSRASKILCTLAKKRVDQGRISDAEEVVGRISFKSYQEDAIACIQNAKKRKQPEPTTDCLVKNEN